MKTLIVPAARLVLAFALLSCTALAITAMISASAVRANADILINNVPNLVFMEKMVLHIHTASYGIVTQFFVLSGFIVVAGFWALYTLGRRHHVLWFIPIGLLAVSYPAAEAQIRLSQAIIGTYSDTAYENIFPKAAQTASPASEPGKPAAVDAEAPSLENAVNPDTAVNAILLLTTMLFMDNPSVMAVAASIAPAAPAVFKVVAVLYLLAVLVLIGGPIWITLRNRKVGSAPTPQPPQGRGTDAPADPETLDTFQDMIMKS